MVFLVAAMGELSIKNFYLVKCLAILGSAEQQQEPSRAKL